ncbi:MAG TPA: hypothetical protein VHF51_08945 [Solirubrobacteraceae bacterium]|nr:hypothetical protein [Solirubrobacteraceae bacterium]
MTPPKSPEPDSSGEERKAPPPRRLPPLWRLAFDLVERPIGAASESFVQSEVFMDALAAGWKVQRRMTREVQRGIGLWLDVLAVPRRSDLTTLVNQVASLERQVRQVTRELERRNGSEISQQRPAATTRRSSAKAKGR